MPILVVGLFSSIDDRAVFQRRLGAPSRSRVTAVRKLPQIMNQKNTKKHLVIAVALTCAATASSALTLGRARGAVLLGQSLSLTVTVQAEADEAADLCFDADVFYGDNRQESSRISVVALRSEGGVPTAVKVSVAAPVDEPVVTVYLRSACGPKTSRKYVLLAELASELAPTPAGEISVRPARPVTPPAAIETAAANAALAKPLPPAPAAKSDVKPRKSRVTQQPQADSPRASVVLKPPVASKARLKLSILDLVDIKDPSLKLSNELSNLPSEDLQKREAAAALWRSLNKSPEDLVQDGARQKALADDVKSLRELSGKNQQDLQDLSGRLLKAESERYSNPLVYGLAGLLLIMGAALGALLLRLRGTGGSDSPWWRSDSEQHEELRDDLQDTAQVSQRDAVLSAATVQPSDSGFGVPSRASESVASSADFSNSSLDIDLDLDSPQSVSLAIEEPHPVERKEIAAAVGSKGTVVPGAHRDLSHSMHASLHAINTQEMLDVRQQADFFMTLGQHEEAIGLLEGSIQENEASNPLVYLDLLKVLHTLSRKPAFDHYRAEFNSIFTGRVQPYATFGQPGNSLDAYPQICAEISELWNTDSAVEFLEQCMVRRPEDAPELYFDIDAFRDLLMLHAVASRFRLNSISDSGLMPFSAVKMAATEEPSLGAPVMPEGLSEMTIPVVPVEPVGSELSVDLDLTSDHNNLIDFDASGLTVNLPRSDK